MVILRSQNQITNFFMILAWANIGDKRVNHFNNQENIKTFFYKK